MKKCINTNIKDAEEKKLEVGGIAAFIYPQGDPIPASHTLNVIGND